jgi:hypothetical protein
LLASVEYAPTSEWCPRLSGEAYDTTRWSNLAIRHLHECAVMFSSTWCGACSFMVVGLPLMTDYFYFSFLFSLLTVKVHNYHLCLLFFNFSPHSLNFLFRPYFFYRSFVFFSILSFSCNFSYVLFFSIVIIFILVWSFFV